MDRVELHCHSHYSVMDGVGTPDEYMARASELGMSHLACTDHQTMGIHRDWQIAAEKAGIVPILGLEGYLSETDRFDRRAKKEREESGDGTSVYNHITLLSQNEVGLRNLNHISNEAWVTGYYNKPRLDMDLLEEFNEGVIVLSGCLSGILPKSLQQGNYEKALMWAKRFKAIFGERFFIEIMTHNSLEINTGLYAIAQETGVLPVVTSDCHHVMKEDLWVQEAMLILSTNPKPRFEPDLEASQKMEMLERFNYLYPDRRMTFQEFGLHLNSALELADGLKAQGFGPEAVTNSMVVASMIGDYPFYQGLDLLPKPKNAPPEEILRNKIEEGLKSRGLEDKPEWRARIDYELSVIEPKGFATYFLIAAEGVDWARSQGILVGPGRGSACSYAICYVLRITDIDPLFYNLDPTRFIDPSRPDMPDIDIDFEDSRREEVKAFMRRKFGEVAGIATYGYFKDKGVIRDAARVFKIPKGEVNAALKNIVSFEQYQNDESTRKFRERWPEVEQLCLKLRGRVRQMGLHAGGLVISKEPISNYAPIQTAKNPQDATGDRVAVVANDMKQVADIGLIKFDFLGLSALGSLAITLDLIRKRHDPDFELNEIPLDDPAVYQMISDGYTKGVFQTSAQASTQKIVEMGGIKNFAELYASNAIVRPGASNSRFGAQWIHGKNGGKVTYIHPDARAFTEETYGSILYQEQLVSLCTEIAGMTRIEGHAVRKAVSKKVLADLSKWGNAFINGAAKKLGREAASDLWNDILASSDYSFAKSHAVAYSTISYWTAWLKIHYPIEFMVGVLSHEKEKEVVLDFLIEAKRLGIPIGLPHINKSGMNFEIQSDEDGELIRMGLCNIKGIKEKTATRILEHAPYADYKTFLETSQTKYSGIGAGAVKGLNAIGGAEFPDNPLTGEERENFYAYLNIPAFSNANLPPYALFILRQMRDADDSSTFIIRGVCQKVNRGPNWIKIDIVDETGSTSFFVGTESEMEVGEMYIALVCNNSILRFVRVDDVNDDPVFSSLLGDKALDIPEGAYKVIEFATRVTKKGDNMGTLALVDRDREFTGAIVFPSAFFGAYQHCKSGALVVPKFGRTKSGTVTLQRVEPYVERARLRSGT